MANKKKKKPRKYRKDYKSEIECSVADKRGHKALKLAKEARKAGVDLPDDLVLSVYLVRLNEMLTDGLHKEALELYDEVVKDLPAWDESKFGVDRLEIALKLGLDEGWSDYGTDTAKTGSMDDIVLTRLKDPRLLAEHSLLADQHPLKHQAQQVLQAWALIDAGRSNDALAKLSDIGRRSPFRGWRIFLQALMAYYEHDDAQVTSLSTRIPENAAVVPLLQILPHLCAEQSANTNIPEAIRKCAMGSDLKGQLAVLEDTMRNGSHSRVRAHLDPFLQKLLDNGQVQFACEIADCLLDDIEDVSLAMEPYMTFTMLRQADRMGDHDIRRSALEAVFGTLELKAEFGDGRGALDDLERAVLLTEIAQEWLTIHKHSDSDDYEECGICPQWEPAEYDYAEDMCPACRINIGRHICTEALRSHPLERTYEIAIEFIEHDPKLKGATRLMRAWRKDFPESVEALKRGLHIYQKLDLWPEAEAIMAELEKCRGASTALVAGRFDIAVKRALALCKSGKNVLDEVKDILQTCSADETWKQALVDTIKWKACGKSRKLRAEYGNILGEHELPILIWHFCRHIYSNFNENRLPAAVACQLESVDATLSSLELLANISHPEWQLPDNYALSLVVEQSGALHDITSESMENIDRYLNLFQKKIVFVHTNDLIVITAPLLTRDHPLCANIWGWRAVGYAKFAFVRIGTDDMPKVVYECVAVALHKGLQNAAIKAELQQCTVDLDEAEKLAAGLTEARIQQITSRETRRNKPHDLFRAIRPDNHPATARTAPAINELSPELQELLEILRDTESPSDIKREVYDLADELCLKIGTDLSEDEAVKIRNKLVTQLQRGLNYLPRPVLDRLQIYEMNGEELSDTLILRAIIEYRVAEAEGQRKKKSNIQQIDLPFDF